MALEGIDFNSVRERADIIENYLLNFIELKKSNDEAEIIKINNDILPRLTRMIMMIDFYEILFRKDLEFLSELEKLYKEPDFNCVVCQDTGVSYWSDDVYGTCFECSNNNVLEVQGSVDG